MAAIVACGNTAIAAPHHGTVTLYDRSSSYQYLARTRLLGAKPPRHVPVWLGRLFIGDPGVSMMTRIRGSSNAKARRVLNWEPMYPSWREGFRHVLRSAA